MEKSNQQLIDLSVEQGQITLRNCGALEKSEKVHAAYRTGAVILQAVGFFNPTSRTEEIHRRQIKRIKRLRELIVKDIDKAIRAISRENK